LVIPAANTPHGSTSTLASWKDPTNQRRSRSRRRQVMSRDQAKTLDTAVDDFLATASVLLTDAVVDRLDDDDLDPVGREVDTIVERIREELTTAIYTEIGAG
jgi:hypothetical protein